MTSELVNWVNSWFLYQGEDPYPARDRMWVYVALVDLIACGSTSRSDMLTVHRYFTYLLRGWNPVTAMVRRSTYSKPESIEDNISFTDDYDKIVKRLLDFKNKPGTSECFRLYGICARNTRLMGSLQHTEYEEEHQLMLILSLWLLNRKMHPQPPYDSTTVRECLSLYYRNRGADLSSSLDVEYVGNAGVSASWLNTHIERLMVSSLSLQEVVDIVSYMTWFSSLIRSERITRASEELPVELKKEIPAIIEKQVTSMHNFLDSRPMEAPEPLCPKNRLLDVFGIHQRKKRSVN